MTRHPLDLPPGGRVGLAVPGSPAYAAAVLALLARGVVPVPLDPGAPAAERQRLLAQVRPAQVVDDPAAVEALAAEWDGRSLPLARPMHLTSGTTGTPKGVWSGLLTEEAARALVAEERDLWRFGAGDVNLVVGPLHHSAPLRFAMGTLLAGGRVVVPGRFDAAALTAAIARDRPTTTFCVPTHLQRLFRHWDAAGAPDLRCFRLVAHAGAPCPPAVKRRLLDAFPAGSTWEFYGSTEGQFTACRGEEWLERPGTVGRARPGRTLTTDPDGTVWCAVPEHARFTYFEDPEKTARAWRDTPAGPAFTVGDLGRLDEAGYLYLDGRREDLVISGGVNVYPVEVEQVLAEHPGVREVAVFGVPDPEWGQRVCAAVVGDVDADALRAWARDRLAPAKRPKQVVVVDSLPSTSTGKLRRRELAERFGRAGRPGCGR